MTTTLADRVRKGAEFLDAKDPGWFMAIDTNRLDMKNKCMCVLGQRHGKFFDGARALGVGMGYETYDLGFDLDNDKIVMGMESWTELRGAWVQEINKRKEGE